jgi:fructose-1,6-bisphosphatase/inositol monophosphatase family enzyme
MTMDIRHTWADFLCGMGRAVRDRLKQEMQGDAGDLADAVAEEGGDVIFRIDRKAEEAILQFLASNADGVEPFLLIAEGIEGGRKSVGNTPPKFRVLCDPIDGSRNIMYDKRSAWFIAAVAEDRGDCTTLADSLASVVVELPTTKQAWADEFVVVEGQEVQARRVELGGSRSRRISHRPSQADDLQNGFAHVTNFFPGTKVLASDLMERIATEVVGPVEPGRAKVFDDQYTSTAGQMVELMLGHDRFCCDLRPLFYQIREMKGDQVAHGLVCHPYDMAGWLVAKQAGVLLTDGFGLPLRPLLDVYQPVHWCGYANQKLRDTIQPVILDWLSDHGVSAPD